MKSLDFKDDLGPFDIIGDVHGCYDELLALLDKLGYSLHLGGALDMLITHPERRKVIFVGDLVDRGLNTPNVLRLLAALVKHKRGMSVLGNHDDKLKRVLLGHTVIVSDGLQKSLDQINDDAFYKKEFIGLINEMPSHLILDEGRLAVTHGALCQEYFGIDSDVVKQYCIYGAPTGRFNDRYLPLFHPWAEEYSGDTLIIHGHVVVAEPKWVNNTVDIDTGCVFGGKLTAFRYPEREFVSVDSKYNYLKE